MFYLHPIDGVIAPVVSVGRLPLLRSSGTLFLLAEGVTPIRWSSCDTSLADADFLFLSHVQPPRSWASLSGTRWSMSNVTG